MKADLKGLLATTATTRSEETWNGWVNVRPVWVSETSCNWDVTDEALKPDNVESCLRASGQTSASGYGDGSMAALDRVDVNFTFEQPIHLAQLSQTSRREDLCRSTVRLCRPSECTTGL